MTSTSVLTRRNRAAAATPWTFRRARLNPVGWAALIAPGALLGAAAAALTTGGRPTIERLVACSGVGALIGVLIARGIEEVRWRSSALSLEVEEPDAALDLMQAVRAEGVRADMVRAGDRLGHSGVAYALRYRAKDDRRVRAVLAEQQG